MSEKEPDKTETYAQVASKKGHVTDPDDNDREGRSKSTLNLAQPGGSLIKLDPFATDMEEK